ncbi:MAG: ribosome biogenesis GTPase Der [Spirochaetaceae bacterium]|nr:ribosome biogenesis GTPase Der [Spirochaetaceae bacterium]
MSGWEKNLTSEKKRRPRVVIAGRPNVGKSTLFNRLYGRRRAITDPTPGVTRDAIEEQCSIAGIPIALVDTGGVKVEYEDSFDDIVAERSLSSLNEADLILFLVEIGEMTAEDHLLVDKLRDKTDRVILVVNKADTPDKDYQASEFYSMGLGDPIPVSAAHGRNMDMLAEIVREKLESVVERISAEDDDYKETDQGPSDLILALVGKPNVGKSTLANRLSGEEYSLVSDIAGTTRDTVIGSAEHKGRRLKIVDTAGIRRKAKVAENVEYYSVNRAIKAMFEADVTLLLIDADEGLSDQDKKITAQAVKKGRTVIMALNKWDEKVPDRIKLKKATERIRFQFPILDWAPLTPISALKGYGIPELLDVILKADRQQSRRVDTSELNKAVAEWVDLTPPPTRKGRPFKVRYVTQVSVKPVRFVAFVNRKIGFPDSYRRFLVNQIRREFGFNLVPVELELTEGKK